MRPRRPQRPRTVFDSPTARHFEFSDIERYALLVLGALPGGRCESKVRAGSEYELKHIEARFKVVTPCFVGSGGENAELRLPSVKGVLRFWWRSLAYAAYAGENGRHAMHRMRRQENDLFGSSEMGQSRVVMRLDMESEPRINAKDEVLRDGDGRVVGSGARYLGYGVMEAFANRRKGTEAGQLIRPCLAAPFEFVLRIGAKDTAPLGRVEPALRLLGLAGGLGARSRKGYGSLNLIALQGDGMDDWRPPGTVDEYRDQLSALLDRTADRDREPEISAFSSQARVELLLERSAPMAVLDEYGKAMVRYRSWGRNGKILDGEPSGRRFPEDHGWMKGEKTTNDFHPRRAVFGLPHNYGKGIEVEPQNRNRRASPLLFHVHQIGKSYAGIALLLRSRFLPEGEKIRARRRTVPANPEWGVLTGFLDENGGRRIWPNG